MLTDDDRKKLEEIEARFAAYPAHGAGGVVDQLGAAVLDLARIVRRLSRSRPDEYAWPTYAALVNDINCVAYAMRYDRPLVIEQRLQIGAAPNQTVLDQVAACQVCDAMLVVRPWIRVSQPVSPEILERLADARITLAIDEDALLEEVPLRDHLIGPDGYGLRSKAFDFKGLIPMSGGYGFFRATHIGPPVSGGVPVSGNSSDPTYGWLADGSKEYGFFLPNGSRITIDITRLGVELKEHPVTVTVGLVAGSYSTRSSRTLPKRKQDWSPRDP